MEEPASDVSLERVGTKASSETENRVGNIKKESALPSSQDTMDDVGGWSALDAYYDAIDAQAKNIGGKMGEDEKTLFEAENSRTETLKPSPSFPYDAVNTTMSFGAGMMMGWQALNASFDGQVSYQAGNRRGKKIRKFGKASHALKNGRTEMERPALSFPYDEGFVKKSFLEEQSQSEMRQPALSFPYDAVNSGVTFEVENERAKMGGFAKQSLVDENGRSAIPKPALSFSYDAVNHEAGYGNLKVEKSMANMSHHTSEYANSSFEMEKRKLKVGEFAQRLLETDNRRQQEMSESGSSVWQDSDDGAQTSSESDADDGSSLVRDDDGIKTENSGDAGQSSSDGHDSDEDLQVSFGAVAPPSGSESPNGTASGLNDAEELSGMPLKEEKSVELLMDGDGEGTAHYMKCSVSFTSDEDSKLDDLHGHHPEKLIKKRRVEKGPSPAKTGKKLTAVINRLKTSSDNANSEDGEEVQRQAVGDSHGDVDGDNYDLKEHQVKEGDKTLDESGSSRLQSSTTGKEDAYSPYLFGNYPVFPTRSDDGETSGEGGSSLPRDGMMGRDNVRLNYPFANYPVFPSRSDKGGSRKNKSKSKNKNNVQSGMLGNDGLVAATIPYKCPVCELSFDNIGELSAHLSNHSVDNIFRCIVCCKAFLTSNDLMDHMRVHTEEKPFVCNICGKGFAQSGYLVLHMRVHSGEKPHKCRVCGKAFGRTCDVKRHMRVHEGEKPFRCTMCEQAFFERNELITHLRLHNGERYTCAVCHTAFGRSYDLQRHLRRFHKDQKEFKCVECGLEFNNSNDLQNHSRVHNGEKSYTCEVCGKIFVQSGHLQTHMRIHSGEKPYVCPVCGKAFANGGDLNKHMRIHNGEKPYNCTVCGRAFRQSGNLQRHARTHALNPVSPE